MHIEYNMSNKLISNVYNINVLFCFKFILHYACLIFMCIKNVMFLFE